eukprot:g17287.t1
MSTPLDRLDVLPILAAFADDAWADLLDLDLELPEREHHAFFQKHRALLRGIGITTPPVLEEIFAESDESPWNRMEANAVGAAELHADLHNVLRPSFQRLFDFTTRLLRPRGWTFFTAPGGLAPLVFGFRLRPGTQVKVKPPGASVIGTTTTQVQGARHEAPEPSYNSQWAAFLEAQYDWSHVGEVVRYLPGVASYMVAFPRQDKGLFGNMIENDPQFQSPWAQFPWGTTWCLTPRGVEELEWGTNPDLRLVDQKTVPAGRHLVEVPYNRLFVDLDAHNDGERDGVSPFETVVWETRGL